VSSEAFVSASTLNLMLEMAPAPPELGKLPSGIAEPGPRSLDAPSWAFMAARTVLREFRLGRVRYAPSFDNDSAYIVMKEHEYTVAQSAISKQALDQRTGSTHGGREQRKTARRASHFDALRTECQCEKRVVRGTTSLTTVMVRIVKTLVRQISQKGGAASDQRT
jgi:hypothetical protein